MVDIQCCSRHLKSNTIKTVLENWKFSMHEMDSIICKKVDIHFDGSINETVFLNTVKYLSLYLSLTSYSHIFQFSVGKFDMVTKQCSPCSSVTIRYFNI